MASLTLSAPKKVAPLGTDPEFDRARELNEARDQQEAGHFIAEVDLADEILRLKSRFSLGQGGDRKSKEQGVILIEREGGFQAKLAAELGLFAAQASRILDRAEYVRRLQLAAAGKKVAYLAGKGKKAKQVIFETNETAQKIAAESLHDVMAGDVPPSRAWVGVVGEGNRRDKQGGDAKRQPVNHYKNCERAQAKWATSLEHFYDFDEKQQDYLTATWGELLAAGVIPEKWLKMAVTRLEGDRS